MSKKLFFNICLAFSFFTCGTLYAGMYFATSIACQEAKKTQSVPSNYWIGALDTPASQAELEKYCFEINTRNPALISIVFLIFMFGTTKAIEFLIYRKK